MFAWIAWNICYYIYPMVVRVFWLLVDDYWLSWWKDIIISFPLLSFFIFLIVCLPVLIYQLQNSTIPPLLPPAPPEPITNTNDQLPNTLFTPPPSPNTRNHSRNVTRSSTDKSTILVDRNITVIDQPKINVYMNDDDLVVKKLTAPKPMSSIVVIGTQFCSNSNIELTITGKTCKSIFDNFCVKDGNGKVIFMIEKRDSILHVRRNLVNAARRSILSMEKKIGSTHNRWQVFKGDSRYLQDLLFVAKQTSVVQIRTKLEVILASNANGAIFDFLVRSRGSEQSCEIHCAGRSGILAQMRKDLTPSVGNDKYMVTVYPNIDCAFIVTLIFILDTINNVLRLKG